MLDSIIDYCKNNVLDIIGVLFALSFVFRKVREIFGDLLAQIFSVRLHTKRYYDTAFMTKRIKSSKKIIRVVCVRNERVTHSDVVETIRVFIENNDNCSIEIYAVSPDLDDCVLEQIMKTLPSPPMNVADMKQQIETNKNKLKSMVANLSTQNKQKISYYEYKALPLIHFCQFDKRLYMGYQMFQRTEQENESFLKYAIIMRNNTKIGRLLLKQVDDLKNNTALTAKISLE